MWFQETSEDDDDDDDDQAAGGSQSEASESGDGDEAGRDLDASLRDLDASADMTGVTSQTDPSGLSLLTEEEADDENDDSEEDIEDWPYPMIVLQLVSYDVKDCYINIWTMLQGPSRCYYQIQWYCQYWGYGSTLELQ
jgi:hypothetical protein